MMIQGTKEQTALYDRLLITKDPEEIAAIRKRLKEISDEQEKEYKKCPFVH